MNPDPVQEPVAKPSLVDSLRERGFHELADKVQAEYKRQVVLDQKRKSKRKAARKARRR